MGKKASVLLINESPLQVLPSLATAIGLNEAIILQQVHYWISHYRQANDQTHYRDGRWWVWNSYSEWRGNFPFWSEATIKRICLNLEKMGVLISAHLSPNVWDRTKWYTIDYDALDARRGENASDASDQIDTMPSAQLDPMRTGQLDPMTLTETTTKTTPETTVREEAAAAAPPPPAEPVLASKTPRPVSKDPTPQQASVSALAEVTGMDTRLNGSRLGKVAAHLARVGATPDLIRQHYGPGGWWYTADWRGQKGEFPRPEAILETWGQWTRPAAPNGHARATPMTRHERNLRVLEEHERKSNGAAAPPSDAIEGRVVRYGK